MRNAQVGEPFDAIRACIRGLGVTSSIIILDTKDPDIFEVRFNLRVGPREVRITQFETIVEELEEAGLIQVSHTKHEIEIGHGTPWGPLDRLKRGIPDLFFIYFRLP